MNSRGILAACDETLEWLLPWWEKRLRAHTDLPIALMDFGMSSCGRLFCKERGWLISCEFPSMISFDQQNISSDRRQHWESVYGKEVWKARKQWLKKPFACAQTPFDETLWLDLDCEVVGSLDPLFDCLKKADVALALETEAAHLHERECGELGESEELFNSGVIVFRKTAPLIQAWAQQTSLRGGEAWGDQQLLSRLIHERQETICLLDPRFNWRMSQGLHIDPRIIHWAGSWGKEFIRQHGGFGDGLFSPLI